MSACGCREPDARYWGDVEQRDLQQWFDLPDAELAARYGGIMNRTPLPSPRPGRINGAFGAGLIVGWTARGDRPEFTIVSGISTGALIAPFAFLGPRYDNVLRHVYTELATANVVEKRKPHRHPERRLGVQRSSSARANRTVHRRRGRRPARGRAPARPGLLTIGTTSLDAARPVTWNVTRIAASGAPGSPVADSGVILASASIPRVPPRDDRCRSGGTELRGNA